MNNRLFVSSEEEHASVVRADRVRPKRCVGDLLCFPSCSIGQEPSLTVQYGNRLQVLITFLNVLNESDKPLLIPFRNQGCHGLSHKPGQCPVMFGNLLGEKIGNEPAKRDKTEETPELRRF